jgi:hypothetical protein
MERRATVSVSHEITTKKIFNILSCLLAHAKKNASTIEPTKYFHIFNGTYKHTGDSCYF